MYNNNMMEIMFRYIVSKKYDCVTLEEFFKSFCLGKDKINSLIFGKNVLINNKKILDKKNEIKWNDEIIVKINAPIIAPFACELDVLYEDDNILVVNKPPKMLIHPDGIKENTLLNAVYFYLQEKEKIQYAYPIHRIDYDTTGIVVFAKDPLTLSFLCAEIEKHHLVKEYVCLCHGKFDVSNGIINSKIGKNRHSKGQIITNFGKDSESSYEVIKNGVISKVRVTIVHGRKHQIRVHMQSIGHPIVGDKIYGYEDGENLKLHFKKIVFYHPFKNKKITIQSKEIF